MSALSRLIRNVERKADEAIEEILAMAVNQEKREELLARVADLIRRTGVSDAERLVLELERELGAPIFSRAGTFAITCRARVPAGAFTEVEMFRARNSGELVTDNLFPFNFTSLEAHVSVIGCDPVLLETLTLTESRNGQELARHHLKSFRGRRAVSFQRDYDRNVIQSVRVGVSPAQTVIEPFEIVFAMSGIRAEL